MRTAAVLMCAVGLTVSGPLSAQAVDNCKNEANTGGSVDGRELRYQNSSQYSEFYTARNDWNTLSKVNILADSNTTVNDIKVGDSNRSDVTWSGLWKQSAGEDSIYINTYYLKSYSSNKRRMVISHEIGHALKLGHFDNRSAPMHCSDARTYSTPQPLDKIKYRSIWG